MPGHWRPRPRPVSNTAPATSSPVRLGSTKPVTASSGRPIDPGWAVTAIVWTWERQRLDELADQSRLADPGLAGDERHRRLLGRHDVGGIDDPRQAGERAGAPDHDRAHPDATAQHGLDARGCGHDGDQARCAVASDGITLPGRREGHVGRDREAGAATEAGTQVIETDLGD